jgi:hypothetical protein
MNNTSAFFAVVLVIFIFPGITVGMGGDSDLFEDLKQQVEIYNQNVGEIPFIARLMSEERIKSEISLDDGNMLTIGIKTDKDAKVISLEKGDISDPTINAYTTENTVRSIMNSDDPVSAFQEAINSGKIKFEGVGLGNKIKVRTMDIAIRLYGFFKCIL